MLLRSAGTVFQLIVFVIDFVVAKYNYLIITITRCGMTVITLLSAASFVLAA